MTTHQQLSGSTEDHFLERQRIRYAVRFNDEFWSFFDDHVRPRLGDRATLVEVGCGPGLFIRDLAGRLPRARLHGLDSSATMIEAARSLDLGPAQPDFQLCDAAATPLPFADGAVDLLVCAATMHLFVDPFAFLGEARRVTGDRGAFLLYDWVRVPLNEYLEGRASEPAGDSRQHSLSLFAVHNKYTVADWRWLFAESRLQIMAEATPHPRARAWLLGALE